MKKEYYDKTVLAMYDIRGIQSYIFATNEVRDIVGASELVENILIEGLKSIISNHTDWDESQFIVEWANGDEAEFLENETICMEVLFIGGGNAYVLFRNGKLCETVNRELAKYVLFHTYSLNLAVAVVPKSDNYMADYDAINLEMRKVKAMMAPVKPVGAMPFMKADSVTGYPLTGTSWIGKKHDITTESFCKQRCLKKDEAEEKIFDNMVTEKGDNSTLAVVHIDGNSMGSRIKDIMQVKTAYKDAVNTMRMISRNIQAGFLHAFSEMSLMMDQKSDLVKPIRKSKLYRKIITAGDDITFVCNPELAIAAVETFVKSVTCKDMYTESGLLQAENHKKYGFSACAGIAFFNSHFPFSDAYQVAEACCSSAKSAAKQIEHRDGGKSDGFIGCYLDYQFCSNIRCAQLREYRERNYSYPDAPGSMISRPYYISAPTYADSTDLDERNKEHNIEVLWQNLKIFTTYSKETRMVRSHAKKLRNAFSLGMEEADRVVAFLNSREVKLPETDRSTWYDALEFMDFYKEGIR